MAKRNLQIGDLPEHYQEQARKQMKDAPAGRECLLDKLQRPVVRGSKCGNIRTEINGEKFASKIEAEVVLSLRAKHGAENIVREVSIRIGAQHIRPDVMRIIERFDDGTFRAELIDAKGSPKTVRPEFVAKMNALKALHGLIIRLIFKKEK